MSHTINHLRRLRLQRSELAVPGSNPDMIEKAANSDADYIFLDIEDAVAPPDKEVDRARRIIEALKVAESRGKGAASLDGKMIDAASERMARNVLATHDAITAGR